MTNRRSWFSRPNSTKRCQGDLLEKTDELALILKEVHPYFLRDPEHRLVEFRLDDAVMIAADQFIDPENAGAF